MAEAILPGADEARALAVGPDSVSWNWAGDARTMMGAGVALALQVAHPAVAGGVREHSDFRADPWGRLLRTLDYVNLLVYGGPDVARATGARLRKMHRSIKGIDPQGRRYHALEPVAFAWVHATLAETIVVSHARFGRPMPYDTQRRFWTEWRGLGRLLGIRDRDLPEQWEDFDSYVERMIAEELEDNDVVRDVLDSLTDPTRPPVPGLGERSWKLARLPATRSTRLATTALLRPSMREKLGLSLTARERAEVELLGAALRAATPVMPKAMRVSGPSYLKWRRERIGRGEFATAAAQAPSAMGTSTRSANARASASVRGPVEAGMST